MICVFNFALLHSLAMKIATFDIGSATIRLLLGEVAEQKLKREAVKRQITRLGDGFSNGHLHPISLTRTLEAAHEFAREARSYGAAEIRAVCTGVARQMADPAALTRALSIEAKLDAYIIEGALEARISALGAANEVDLKQTPFLLMDIGGFSTEFILVEGSTFSRAISLDLGTVRLTEKHMRHDPPLPEEMEACAVEARQVLTQSELLQRSEAHSGLVGTAGTVTTLAAMDLKMERYEPYRLNRHVLRTDTIRDLLHRLLSMPALDRLTIPGLEKGREDLMPAGAVICLEVLAQLGLDRMTVTEGGVLEGLALWPEWPPASEPMIDRSRG